MEDSVNEYSSWDRATISFLGGLKEPENRQKSRRRPKAIPVWSRTVVLKLEQSNPLPGSLSYEQGRFRVVPEYPALLASHR